MQWDALAFLPHPTDITDIAPPSTTRLRSLWSASLSSGSDQRRIRGCGTGLLLAGPDSLPLWLCRVCAFVLLRCFSCSHTVLPKEHSLGVIFFLLTFLMFMLYFSSILLAFHYWLYSVWLFMWWIIKNLEPWKSPIWIRGMAAGDRPNLQEVQSSCWGISTADLGVSEESARKSLRRWREEIWDVAAKWPLTWVMCL